METKTQNLILGLVIGILATLLISNYSVNNQNYGMMKMMGMGRGVNTMTDEDMMSMMGGDDHHGMDSMVEELEGVSGADFDKKFIESMIEHHQGAIDMARLIPAKSERPELLKMGEDIINVQSSEIDMMNNWLNTWFTN